MDGPLANLLNGLAVSDVAKIVAEAEILAKKSKILAYLVMEVYLKYFLDSSDIKMKTQKMVNCNEKQVGFPLNFFKPTSIDESTIRRARKIISKSKQQQEITTCKQIKNEILDLKNQLEKCIQVQKEGFEHFGEKIEKLEKLILCLNQSKN